MRSKLWKWFWMTQMTTQCKMLLDLLLKMLMSNNINHRMIVLTILRNLVVQFINIVDHRELHGLRKFYRMTCFLMLVFQMVMSTKRHILLDIWLTDFFLHSWVDPQKTIVITMVKNVLIWLELFLRWSLGCSLDK